MHSAKGFRLIRRSGAGVICQHGEAFALMKYQNRATGRIEWLWNSRDGVTPFGINDPQVDEAAFKEWKEGHRAAAEGGGYADWIKDHPDPSIMNHADWHEDSFQPNFVPPVGMRVFFSYGDAPASVKAEIATAWAKRLEEFVASGYPPTREVRAQPPFGYKPIDPAVAVVDGEIHRMFHDQARDNPYMPPPRQVA